MGQFVLEQVASFARKQDCCYIRLSSEKEEICMIVDNVHT